MGGCRLKDCVVFLWTHTHAHTHTHTHTHTGKIANPQMSNCQETPVLTSMLTISQPRAIHNIFTFIQSVNQKASPWNLAWCEFTAPYGCRRDLLIDTGERFRKCFPISSIRGATCGALTHQRGPCSHENVATAAAHIQSTFISTRSSSLVTFGRFVWKIKLIFSCL